MRNDLTSKKIAITGGTGFLGSHLLPILMEKGADLRCLARNGRVSSGIEVVAGDCRDLPAMQKLLDGADIFIYMAALLFGSSWQDYFRENVRAAETAKTALQSLPEGQRPKKIIFISSLSAAGPCAAMPGKKESEASAPVSAYGWSKLWCETILATAPCATLTVLRPPIIYGSGDRGLLPLFKSVKKGFGASPGAFRKFPVSVIHARDAARAIALACEQDLPGTFHLSDGQYCDMDIFCHQAGKALGRKGCRVLHTPLPLMKFAAWLTQGVSGISGWAAKKAGKTSPRPPHWNPDKYLEASQAGWLADGSLFTEKSGFLPEMDLENGLKETVRGYRAAGWL